MDFKQTIHDIHPSLDDSQGVKDLTDDTIKKLTAEIQRLREVKIQRMQKVCFFFFFFGWGGGRGNKLLCIVAKRLLVFLLCLVLLILGILPASSSCNYPCRALEFDGHSNGGAKDV